MKTRAAKMTQIESLALTFECPTCGVRPGYRCASRNPAAFRFADEDISLDTPHDERLKVAFRCGNVHPDVKVKCPQCGADPGYKCFTRNGLSRQAVHRQRSTRRII